MVTKGHALATGLPISYGNHGVWQLRGAVTRGCGVMFRGCEVVRPGAWQSGDGGCGVAEGLVTKVCGNHGTW